MQIACFHNTNDENGYLSNLFLSDFTLGKLTFSSMEQYMMYQKAICFNDTKTASEILRTSDVGHIKALGRMVANYNENYWNGVRQIIIYEGLLAKFSQNQNLAKLLIDTKNALIAECAVNDLIWGIGLSLENPDRLHPKKWKGKNLLGYALMMVRTKMIQNL